jgi:hypothetical protein
MTVLMVDTAFYAIPFVVIDTSVHASGKACKQNFMVIDLFAGGNCVSV